MASVDRRTVGLLVVGALLLSAVLWFLVGSFPPQPLPDGGGGFAPGLFVFVAASILGGLSMAHAVSRSIPGPRDTLPRLLAYPLVTGLAVVLPSGYLTLSPNYGGFPAEWVALAVFAALFPAAAVKGRARSRRRSA